MTCSWSSLCNIRHAVAWLCVCVCMCEGTACTQQHVTARPISLSSCGTKRVKHLTSEACAAFQDPMCCLDLPELRIPPYQDSKKSKGQDSHSRFSRLRSETLHWAVIFPLIQFCSSETWLIKWHTSHLIQPGLLLIQLISSGLMPWIQFSSLQ